MFYVYACMYCVCFVVCRCLYVSLYLLLLLCFVCIASALFFVYAGVGVCALAGAAPPPSSLKKLRQNYYYVEGIDGPYLRFELLTV